MKSTMSKKPAKKQVEDFRHINEEEYDDYKYMVKRLMAKSQVNLNMWFYPSYISIYFH